MPRVLMGPQGLGVFQMVHLRAEIHYVAVNRPHPHIHPRRWRRRATWLILRTLMTV